jgi:hypothetical protein
VLLLKVQYFVAASLLLLLGMVSPCLGQMMSGIGVSQGELFTYRYTCYFNSNDSSISMPPDFAWINQTDYYMMNVTGISGSTVNYATSMRMVNGTIIMGTGGMNMASGANPMSGYNPMGMTGVNSYFFMSSNVGMMGRMYSSSSNSPTINDTVTMGYSGGQRTANHMSSIINLNGMMNQTDYYFDQATGAMVEWRQQSIKNNGDLQSNSTQLVQITQSSVWAVPEFSVFLIVPVLCVVTAFVFFIRVRQVRCRLKPL